MKRRSAYIFLMLLLFVFAAFERFYRITLMGLDGSDTFFYIDTARQWVKGQFTLTEHYRPLGYWLFTKATAWLGVNDYSIKILCGAMDIASMGLMLLLVRQLGLSLFFGLLGLIFYVSLPVMVEQSRMELLHIPTNTFFLLFLICFFQFLRDVKANRERFLIWLFASGLTLALSLNVHPSLINVVPGYFAFVIYLGVAGLQKGERLRLNAIRLLIVSSTGFALPFLWVLWRYGFEAFWFSFTAGGRAQSGGVNSPLLVRTMHGWFQFVAENTSGLFALFWLAMVLYFVLSAVRGKKWPLPFQFLAVLSLTYVLMYNILTPKFQLARSYIPFLVPVFIFSLWSFRRVLVGLRINPRFVQAALAIAVVILSVANRVTADSLHVISVAQRPSVYKEILQALGDRAGNVLVTPLIAPTYRTPLAQPSLLGNRVYYILELDEPTYPETLKAHSIHIVVFLRQTDNRIPVEDEFGRPVFERKVPSLLHLKPQEYTATREEEFLAGLLKDQSWQDLYNSDRVRIWVRP